MLEGEGDHFVEQAEDRQSSLSRSWREKGLERPQESKWEHELRQWILCGFQWEEEINTLEGAGKAATVDLQFSPRAGAWML